MDKEWTKAHTRLNVCPLPPKSIPKVNPTLPNPIDFSRNRSQGDPHFTGILAGPKAYHTDRPGDFIATAPTGSGPMNVDRRHPDERNIGAGTGIRAPRDRQGPQPRTSPPRREGIPFGTQCDVLAMSLEFVESETSEEASREIGRKLRQAGEQTALQSIAISLVLILSLVGGGVGLSRSGPNPKDGSVSVVMGGVIDLAAYASLNESGLPPGTIWSFSAQGVDGAAASARTSTPSWSWSSPTNFTWSFQISDVVLHPSTGNETLYPSPECGEFATKGPGSWGIGSIHFSTNATTSCSETPLASLFVITGIGIAAAAVLVVATLVVLRRRRPPPTSPVSHL